MSTLSNRFETELGPLLNRKGLGHLTVAGGRPHKLLLGGILTFYLALATAMTVTKTPVCDEGFYADPAINLVRNGKMGSPVLESAGSFLKGIDRYTYWEMPLHIVVQAGWYKIFGVSLFSMRALSIAAGLVALGCWYVIVVKVSKHRGLALLVLFLSAIDTSFLILSATGRADMLSVAFGAAAQASYLALRARALRLALLVGHSFVVASGLTHPVGGLVALASLLFLYQYLDRRRFVFSDLPVILAPYAAGALGWGLYISESPSLFWAQFGGNSAGRLWAWRAPFTALKSEVMDRLVGGYRIGSSSWTPLANVRLLILAGYLFGLLTVVLHKDLRQKRLAVIVLAETVFTFFILVFFEGSKQPWYLIHLVWPFTVTLALAIRWYWQERPASRQLLTVCLLGFSVIQLGYPVLLVKKNNYKNSYLSTIDFITRAKGHQSVFGSAELGFGLGFENVKDDPYLGYYTQKEPAILVLDRNYRASLSVIKRERPKAYRFLESLLSVKYSEVYSDAYYTVFARRQSPL